MPKSLITRRTMIAASSFALTTGLLTPAVAQGLAPTPSMRGGSNNYRPGAAIVDLSLIHI